MTQPPSLNFGFLHAHDPWLTTYAAQAERYVFDDPNTSLLKLRQFAELLARHVAAFHTIDTTDNDLRDVIAVIRRKRLAPRDATELFDQLRLRGNEAAHHERPHRADTGNDRRIALAGLITAYKLAEWFQQTFVDPDFAPGPYKPPPYPRDVEAALRTELDGLREDAARYQQQLAKSQGQIKELDRIRAELQQQAQEAQAASQADRTLLVVAQQAHEQEKVKREAYERRLQELQRTIAMGRWRLRAPTRRARQGASTTADGPPRSSRTAPGPRRRHQPNRPGRRRFRPDSINRLSQFAPGTCYRQ